jgi:phosphatidylglycerol:prolipoprotein diacylglycerol transferase
MFINNINPVLLNLGPFEIRYYGIIYALGFLIGYLFLRRRIKQKRLKLKYDDLDSFFLWLIIGVVVGARLFEIIFFSWPYYSIHPVEMLMIWNGGLSFHGGFVGAALVVYLFSKKHKLHFYDIADSLVIPTAFALALGRVANFINSEHYGMIADAAKTPWCVVYQKVDSFCRHPSQLYESMTNLITVGVLMCYDNYSQRKGTYKKGTLFWLFVTLYGLLRFLVNFYRDDPSYQFFLGISVGQWLSVIMIVVGAVFLVRINLLAPKKSL